MRSAPVGTGIGNGVPLFARLSSAPLRVTSVASPLPEVDDDAIVAVALDARVAGAHAELTREVVVHDDDARFDQHLADRDVQRRDEAADVGEAVSDVSCSSSMLVRSSTDTAPREESSELPPCALMSAAMSAAFA